MDNTTNINISYIANFLIKFLTAILFIAAYTYIVKLEEAGCACSVHPYRAFIKSFSLFAIGYLLLSMFAPPSMVFKHLGPEAAALYNIVDIAFLFVAVVYFYQAIVYTRYLINEKCKCSEDIRREIVMWGSIVEMIIIVQALLLSLIIPIIGDTAMNIINRFDNTRESLSDAIHNPVSSMMKIPSNTAKILKKTKNTVTDVGNGVFKKLSYQNKKK
jgi:hypothetical protein